jgi:hypothetical protein
MYLRLFQALDVHGRHVQPEVVEQIEAGCRQLGADTDQVTVRGLGYSGMFAVAKKLEA